MKTLVYVKKTGHQKHCGKSAINGKINSLHNSKIMFVTQYSLGYEEENPALVEHHFVLTYIL